MKNSQKIYKRGPMNTKDFSKEIIPQTYFLEEKN